MSKDKTEDDAKKGREKKLSRSSAAMRGGRSRRSRGDSGTCLRICGVTWRTLRIQKKMNRSEVVPRAPQSEHMSVASKLDCCDGLQAPKGNLSAIPVP